MLIDRGLDKEDVVHIYNGILLSHKKERNNAICNNMDGPTDYHTKRSKSDRERQIWYDITYMWNLKYDTNELIYETEIDSQTWRTDLWLPRGKEGGTVCWEFGISRCKLLYIEWINNKEILCSTGNYIQYLVINHNGKKIKNIYIMYNWIIFLYTRS